jgi:hypothetical protein
MGCYRCIFSLIHTSPTLLYSTSNLETPTRSDIRTLTDLTCFYSHTPSIFLLYDHRWSLPLLVLRSRSLGRGLREELSSDLAGEDDDPAAD